MLKTYIKKLGSLAKAKFGKIMYTLIVFCLGAVAITM